MGVQIDRAALTIVGSILSHLTPTPSIMPAYRVSPVPSPVSFSLTKKTWKSRNKAHVITAPCPAGLTRILYIFHQIELGEVRDIPNNSVK